MNGLPLIISTFNPSATPQLCRYTNPDPTPPQPSISLMAAPFPPCQRGRFRFLLYLSSFPFLQTFRLDAFIQGKEAISVLIPHSFFFVIFFLGFVYRCDNLFFLTFLLQKQKGMERAQEELLCSYYTEFLPYLGRLIILIKSMCKSSTKVFVY